MRVLIQRVSRAAVHVEGSCVAQIGHGFLLFVGLTHEDSQRDIGALCHKIVKLRVFDDGLGKMNLAISDVGGEILVVSQFTLYGSASKGNRPSFIQAMHPDTANSFYETFVSTLRNLGISVQCGVFGANMDVALHNDGPVTLMLESIDGKII